MSYIMQTRFLTIREGSYSTYALPWAECCVFPKFMFET